MTFFLCPLDNCLYLVPRCNDEKCANYTHPLPEWQLSVYVTDNTHEKK